MEKVFEIYIRTTPQRLWDAITDGEIRSKYNFGSQISSDWTPGSRREGVNNQLYDGWPMILSGLKTWLETGEVLTTPGSLLYR